MPVDGYLLFDDATETYGYHQNLYIAAKKAAIKQVQNHGDFVLYLTGITIAGIGAVDGMRAAGILHPVVCNYDKAFEKYVQIAL